mmetsp:Transcript_10098/g.12799  ORF Transcript_10098/g.12799 Transcript_10098/m.12799 type:complete len:119 (+) Transcript_10098:157-513(+)
MAQGGKLKKLGGGKQKSVASTKKKATKQLSKGRKIFKSKGREAIIGKEIQDTSKAINKKNEISVCAKAVSAGGTFFMSDIKDAGKREINRLNRNQRQAERGSNKLSSRLKEQLRKMGR